MMVHRGNGGQILNTYEFFVAQTAQMKFIIRAFVMRMESFNKVEECVTFCSSCQNQYYYWLIIIDFVQWNDKERQRQWYFKLHYLALLQEI